MADSKEKKVMYHDAFYDDQPEDGERVCNESKFVRVREWFADNHPRFKRYRALHRSPVIDRAVKWMRVDRFARWAFFVLSSVIIMVAAVALAVDAPREQLLLASPAILPQAVALVGILVAKGRSYIPRRATLWVPNMERTLEPRDEEESI